MRKHILALLLLLLMPIAISAQQNATGASATLQSAAVAVGNGTTLTTERWNAARVRVTIAATATVTFEVQTDNTNWDAVIATNVTTDVRATTATATGTYIVVTNGAPLRARISAWTSGAVTVTARQFYNSTAYKDGGGGGLTIGTTAITGGTSGRVLFDNAGVVGEDADLSFATDTLTFTKGITTQLTDSGLTSGRVPIASTGGLLADDADLTFATDTLTFTKGIASTNLTIGAGSAITSSGGGGAIASAAFVATGTSGATIPLLNGNNVHSGTLTLGSNLLIATSPKITTGISDANGNSIIAFTPTASAVDGFTLTNAATANPATVIMAVTGSDTNINIQVNAKGSGIFALGGITSSFAGLSIGNDANSQAAIRATRADSGAFAPIISGSITITDATSLTLSSTQTAIFDSARSQGVFGKDWTIGFAAVQANAGVGNALDVNLYRVAPKVFGIGSNSSTPIGWMQWAGEAYLGTNQTNATTTPVSTTLSATLQAGRNYGFKFIGYLSDSISTDGAVIDFDGGTATATNFRTQCTAFDTALNLSQQVSALATDIAATTFTGNGMFECHGSITVNAAGTFIPRFFQNAHTTGTLTILVGSHLITFDMP